MIRTVLLGIVLAAPPSQASARDAAVAELGKHLFFDKRLSGGGTVSCATCHDPKKGWTDQRPVSLGARGRAGKRNAPTILNLSLHYSETVFWDGRSKSLEEAVAEPIKDPFEMDSTIEGSVQAIARVPGYAPLFKAAFGDEAVTFERISRSIAAFERTLVSTDSPYDRYQSGDPSALTDSAKRGMKHFFGKAACAACHSGPALSDGQFHNIGIGTDKKPADPGRFKVTRHKRDQGAYKTPTMRNLRYTFPYMHDGSMATLEEVVEFYDRGGLDNEWMDPDVQPLHLTAAEKKELVDFLDALNGDPRAIDPPKLP